MANVLFAGLESFKTLLDTSIQNLPEINPHIEFLDKTFQSQDWINQQDEIIKHIDEIAKIQQQNQQNKQIDRFDNLKNYIINYKTYAPHLGAIKKVINDYGVDIEDLERVLVEKQDFLYNMFNMRELSFANDEDAKKILQIAQFGDFLRLLYGKTKVSGIDEFKERTINAIGQLGQFIDDKQRRIDFQEEIKNVIENKANDLWNIREDFIKFSDITGPGRVSTELETIQKKGEKIKKGANGKLISVQDVLASTIGLKSKAITGITVDTLIEPGKAFQDFTNFLQKEQQLQNAFDKFLDGKISSNELIDSITKFTPYQDRIRNIGQFKQQLDTIQKTIPNVKKHTEVIINLYDEIDRHTSGLQQDDKELVLNVAKTLIGSKLALDNNMNVNIKNYFDMAETIKDLYAQIEDLLESGKKQSLNPEQRQQFDDLKQSIRDVIIGNNDSVAKVQETIFQYQGDFIKQGLDSDEQFFKQLAKFERENLVDIQVVLQSDAQKTLDKSNKHVVISTIVNALTSNQDYTKQQHVLVPSMYNALLDGDIQEFNEQAIQEMLKSRVNDLEGFGFSQDFIQFVRNANPQDITLKTIRENFSTNINSLINIMFDTMQSNIQTITKNQDIPQSIKSIVQYSALSRFINVGETLGLKTNEDLMRKQFVTLGYVEIQQQKQFNQFIDEAEFSNVYNEVFRTYDDINQIYDGTKQYLNERIQYRRQIQDIAGVDEYTVNVEQSKKYKAIINKQLELREKDKIDFNTFSQQMLQDFRFLDNNELEYLYKYNIHDLYKLSKQKKININKVKQIDVEKLKINTLFDIIKTNEQPQQITQLTKIKIYNTLIQKNAKQLDIHAGSYSLNYLQQRKFKDYIDIQIYPQARIGALTDFSPYRFIRDPKDKELTRAQKTGAGFENQLKGGLYRKIRPMIAAGIYGPDIGFKYQLPPSMEKHLQYQGSDTTQQLHAQQYKQSTKDKLNQIISGTYEDEDLEEIEYSATQMRKGESIELYYTGYNIPFKDTLSGGLFITPGSGDYFQVGYEQATHQAEIIFEQQKEAMSQFKYKVGTLQKMFTDYMYKNTEMGLPIGQYTLTQSRVKNEVMYHLRNQLLYRGYSYTKKSFDINTFDIGRQIFLSTEDQNVRDYKLYYVLNNVFEQNKLIEFLEEKQLNTSKITIKHLNEFLQQRIPTLTTQEILKLKELFGDNFTHTDLINYIQTQLPKQIRDIYTSNKLYRGLKFDLHKTADYLIKPHSFEYQGVGLHLVPHQLVDAISTSSPNTTGSTVALKPYGHQATPIQEQINLFQKATDSVRVVNTYGQKQANILINHGQIQNSEIVQQIYEINRQKRDLLLKGNVYDGILNEEAAGIEQDGLLIPTIVVGKENEEFFKNILGTELNLAGDQYFINKDLRQGLSRVQRGRFGGFIYEDLSELVKFTGGNRSKGMTTYNFERRIAINVNGRRVEIGLVMNEQGKRKNKLAEFGQGALRAQKYIYGDSLGYKSFEDGVDVVNLHKIDNISAREATEQLYAKQQGYLEIYDPKQQKWINTGIASTLIMHKVYAYTAKSHDFSWVQISNQQAQVLPQLHLFKQNAIVSLLLSGDDANQASEQAIHLNNMQVSLQEGAQAGQIAQLLEKNVINQTGQKTGYLKKTAGSHQRNVGILRGVSHYLDAFKSVRTKNMQYDNVTKLRYMQDQLRSQGQNDRRLIRTQELLETLSDILSNDKITLSSGTNVLAISEKQARILQEFAGDEILMPSIASNFFQQLFGFSHSVQTKNKWGTMYLTNQLIQTADQAGKYERVAVGKNKYIQMSRLIVPKLFDNSQSQLYLSLEAETFVNAYQGIYSILQQQAHKDYRMLNQGIKFYQQRMLSLGDIQTRQLTRQMSKKHGMQIYALHATGSNRMGGVKQPKKQFMTLLKSQLINNYIDENTLKGIVGEDEFNEIMQQKDSATLFDRWSKQALLIRNNKGTPVVYYNPDSTDYQNTQEISDLINQNVPIFKNSVTDVRTYYKNGRQFKKELAIQIAQMYKGYSSIKRNQQHIPTISAGLQSISQMDYDPKYYAKKYGEMWGLIQRHPIIGHLPHARIAGFSQDNTIDVPLFLAEQIAGDDDGDMINLLPYILIQQDIYKKGMADITQFGVFDYTMVRKFQLKNRTDEIQQELQELYDRSNRHLF